MDGFQDFSGVVGYVNLTPKIEGTGKSFMAEEVPDAYQCARPSCCQIGKLVTVFVAGIDTGVT